MANSGEWKLSSVGQALVIGPGTVYLGDKKPKGLHLEEVLEMIHKHPNKGHYSKKIPRVTTLGEAISAGDIKLVGKVRNTYSSIDLYLLETKREFESLPKIGRQLLANHYKSRPRRVKC